MPEEPSSGTEFAASQESKLVLQSRGGNAAGEDEDGDGEQGDGAERGDHDGLLSLGRDTVSYTHLDVYKRQVMTASTNMKQAATVVSI